MKVQSAGSIALLFSLAFVAPAKAETYIGASIGGAFSQKLTHAKGDENTNYPDPPDFTPGTTSPFLPGSGLSDAKLKNSLLVGFRAGHFFDAMPDLGVEMEVNYSHPNFKEQNITLTHPGYLPLVGQGYVTEDQLAANVRLFQLSVSGIYRYRDLEKLTPYVGVGPSLNMFKITGTGYSGILVSPAGACAGFGVCPGPGPNINDTKVKVGLNFKCGVEYRLDEHWGLALEYKYDWSPLKISHFRSISNAHGDFQSQSIGMVLMEHF